MTRGILHADAAAEYRSLVRRAPGRVCSAHIDWYWIVEWSVPDGEEREQKILPYPSVHLVLERRASAVFGVVTGTFTRALKGTGRAFGVKFRPGAFGPFLGDAVASITDRSIPIERIFDIDVVALEDDVLDAGDVDGMVDRFEAFMVERLPEVDDDVVLVRSILTYIDDDDSVMTADDVATRFHLHPRKLQRLFHRHVGVGPKWIVTRKRIHEAAERLRTGKGVDLAALAVDLGYYDQAHFIRDFRTLVGTTPERYARLNC